MSSLHRMLDSLFKSYINGSLRDVSRAETGSSLPPYSQVWLKRVVDPYKVKGLERAYSFHAIMRGITKVISIIYGSNHFQIQFMNQVIKEDLLPGKHSLAISVEPLKRRPKGYTFYDLVDVITGSAIHQATHLREGSQLSLFQHEDERKELELIYHLVLDVIHDQIITLQYPGFEGYLIKYRKYWMDKHLRKKWGQKEHSRIHLLIQALRDTEPIHVYKRNVQRAYFYVLYLITKNPSVDELRKLNLEEITYNLFAILFDEKLFLHSRDLNYMSERLVLAKEGLTTPGENGNQKGGKKGFDSGQGKNQEIEQPLHFPIKGETIETLSSMSIAEYDDLHVPFEKIDEITKQLPAEQISKGWLDEYCHVVEGNSKAAKMHGLENQEMEYLIRVTEEKPTPLVGTDSKYPYQVFHTIPKIALGMKAEYHQIRQAVRSQIVLLRNQLSWANTKIIVHQYGLKSGTLDEDALYRAPFAQDVFKNRMMDEAPTRKLDLVLLVDGSSSMYEQVDGGSFPKYIAARQLAALFVEAMELIDTVQTWVYSFDQETKTSIGIRELYSSTGDGKKERIAAMKPGLRTPEYEALLAVTTLLETVGRAGVQKVFLVLSDGQPGDDLIPYHVQKVKLKELIRSLHGKGHLVMQIALGPEADSKEIYPHCLPFPREGFDRLVHDFGKLIRKLL